MNDFQFSMLLSAAAFSLVSMVIIFLVALFSLTIFLKPKPSTVRIFIAFVASWVLASFYLPFKSVTYYMQHSGEMYIAELVISIIALFAVTKLSPTKITQPDEPKV